MAIDTTLLQLAYFFYCLKQEVIKWYKVLTIILLLQVSQASWYCLNGSKSTCFPETCIFFFEISTCEPSGLINYIYIFLRKKYDSNNAIKTYLSAECF